MDLPLTISNNEGKPDFAAPFVLKILSGGEISDQSLILFLFSDERNEAQLPDLRMLFLCIMIFSDQELIFMPGQFQVSDPLFKGELRYTLEPYKIYGTAPGSSSADLKYDRGVMFEKDFSTGTTVVGEILNGCGIGEAREGYLFDKDKYKNFMLRINQSIGKYILCGVFGYTGKEVVYDPLL